MEPVRQLRLLAAGCQPWNPNLCVAAGPWFAYAATQSVYVYRESRGRRGVWRLDSILTGHSKLISCLDWLPGGLLATAGGDRQLCAWSVAEQRVVARAALPAPARLVAWSPHDADQLVVSGARGPLLVWRCLDSDSPAPLRADSSSPFAAEVQQLAWHPRCRKLAVGHRNGTVSLVPTDGGRVRRHVPLPEPHAERDQPVTALAWDPLSEDYLLLCQQQTGLLLVDTAQFTAIMAFERPSTGGDCHLAWFTNAPGVFLAADTESGVLSVYSAGAAAPLQRTAVKASGFHGARLLAGEGGAPAGGNGAPPGRLLAVFGDGGVGVLCLTSRRWEFLQESGHTETIFDAQFQPGHQERLATGSFDGTIKVWSARSLQPVDEHRASTIVYAVSWAPADLDCLAAATSTEGVLVWSLQKHRVVKQFREHGSDCVYSVSWNGVDSRRLASAGGDGTCVVRQLDGTLLHTYRHPAGVYGCAWRDAARLATGCKDGAVRVFDVTRNQSAPLLVLKGHVERAFQVRWNPVLEHVLASGSDDGTVRVWDTDSSECLRVLSGHHSHVRGLAWCPALAHVLVSGSWDYTIRVWDARAGRCLHVIKEHAADVYGLSLHPARPLLLVSCSRDSTVRLWDLAPLFSRLHCRALVTDRAAEVLADPAEASSLLSPHQEPLLAGEPAALLRGRWSSAADRLRLVGALFTPDPDAQNLWDLVSVQLGETDPAKLSAEYSDGVVHQRHLVAALTSRAARLERAPPAERLSTGGGAAAARRAAADLYLRCGELRRHCDTLLELGEWERALALAPGVSLDYWRRLAERRAAQLLAEDSDGLVALSLAAGRPQLTAELHRRRGEPLAVLEAAMVQATRGGPPSQPAEDDAPASPERGPPPAQADNRAELLEAAEQASEWHLSRGRPVLAACCHLAVDDVPGCVRALVRGHLRELAVLLYRLLAGAAGPAPPPQSAELTEALTGLARRCHADGDWPTGVALLQLVQDPAERQHGLRELAIAATGDEARAEQALRLAGFGSAAECRARAQSRAEAGGAEDEEQVTLLLLSGQLETALALALTLLDSRLLSEDAEDQQSALRLAQLCAAVPRRHAGRLSGFLPSLCALAGFAGGRAALRRGHHSVAELMLRHTAAGLPLVSQRAPRLTLQHVHTLLEEARAAGGDRGAVRVPGCQLPGHGRLLRCYLTGQVIRGPVYRLEDGESALSAGLAVMWAAVNRYSPLRTGAQMYP
ncbi:WD repeat-containing protein 17 [Amphibalanus amphitrite]|uniref:WD repeat-containing protein 17 n=1 Tax=Amphibalanus amphitrite TaxID=1232801 RepID=A0A6A4X8J8_AMPAM|nr:WD repeat-containing protein 17 [Amphibalanus amphitrite]